MSYIPYYYNVYKNILQSSFPDSILCKTYKCTLFMIIKFLWTYVRITGNIAPAGLREGRKGPKRGRLCLLQSINFSSLFFTDHLFHILQFQLTLLNFYVYIQSWFSFCCFLSSFWLMYPSYFRTLDLSKSLYNVRNLLPYTCRWLYFFCFCFLKC